MVLHKPAGKGEAVGDQFVDNRKWPLQRRSQEHARVAPRKLEDAADSVLG
jgi:hypothetical protein